LTKISFEIIIILQRKITLYSEYFFSAFFILNVIVMTKEDAADKLKILIIEDEPGLNKLIQNLLKHEGFTAEGVFSGNEAVEWVKNNPENLLIIDYLLSDMTALDLVEKLESENLKFNFIVLTGMQDQRIAIELLRKGARDYIIKDSNFIDIIINVLRKTISQIENEKKLEIANKKIMEQNELLTNLISHLPNYIYWKDNNLNYKGCNEKYAKLLGFKASSDIIEKNDTELGINSKDINKFLKHDLEVIKNGNSFLGIDEIFIKKIDKKVPFLTHRAPLKDQAGNISGIIVISTDISELEEIDETIKVSEERFRELFDNMADGVAIYTQIDNCEDFLIKDFNAAFEKNEQIKREEIIAKSVLEIFPSIKNSGLFDIFKKVYKTGKPEHFSNKTYKDYRISSWFDNFIYKLSTGDIVTIYQNLTTQKQHEELLNEYKLAIESSSDMIYCINKDYKFIFANKAFLNAFCVSQKDIETKNADDILGKDLIKSLAKDHIEKTLKGEVYELESERVFPKIGNRIIKLKYYPIIQELIDDKKNVKYNAIVAVIRDITDQKNLEIELKKLNEELENRVKSRTEELTLANNELESFSYSVSHDLRAPLRHIFGFSELLTKELKENLNETSSKYLSNIIESSKKMSILIDDLLSFSRMGRASLNFISIDLNKLLSDSISFLENEIKNRDIEWNIAQLPKIQGDLSMLRQALINFISNALKYTRKKKKTVIDIGYTEDDKYYNFFIKDNGIGFDPAYKDKLFGVFQRLHSDKEFEGTGIGLALVKRIILRHGGIVRAESKMGKGAAFYFTLPKG
jgi:PAS domain S-box-containing protein